MINILLIGDNLDGFQLIENLLDKSDNFKFTLVHKDSFSKGFSELKNRSIDIILLDLNFPQTNGIDIILKTRAVVKKIPIVVLSGLKDEIIARSIINVGVQDYLVKGAIDSDSLIRSINYAIMRNKMLIAMEAMTETLQSNEKRFRNIIEKNADSIIILNKNGLIAFSNPSAENIFRIPKSELIGQFFGRPKKNDNIIEIEIAEKFKSFPDIDIQSVEIDWEGDIAYLLSIRDLSERKRMMNKILKSEKKYRNLFENSPISLWEEDFSEIRKYLNNLKKSGVKDIRRYFDNHPKEVKNCLRIAKIIDINDSTLKLLKVESKEQVLQSFSYFLTEKSVEVFKEEIIHLSNYNTNFETETTIKTINGELLNVLLRLTLPPGYEESWRKIIISLTDITERIKLEKKKKESEKKYRDLFNNSPYPILILDLKGEIVDFNLKLESLVGFNKKSQLHKRFLEIPIINKKQVSEIEKIMNTLKKGEDKKSIEIEFMNEKREKFWLKLNFSLIELGDEELIHVLIQDITILKYSKQALKKLEHRLQEINLLIENAPMGILLIHPKGKILRINKEAENLFKYKQEEILNFNITDLFDSQDLKFIEEHYYNDIYDLSKPNSLEVSVKRKDGVLINVEITSNTLRVVDSIIIQSFFSDITKRKKYEKHRQLLLNQLFSSLEFKSKFLANISHELRTPLNAILGFSQLLLEESYGKLNENQIDFLTDINSAGSYLLTLINTILDLSKIEAGKFYLNIEEFNLLKILEEINTIIRPLYMKKKLKYVTTKINNHKNIIADPLRFKQVLYNLLSNAIKFTKNGIITLRVFEKIDHWEFQISDTGVGIAEKDYKIVFREFERIKNDKIRSTQGAGLGLALTKQLIKLHRGEIWFKSELGKGTTFFFTIPKKNKE